MNPFVARPLPVQETPEQRRARLHDRLVRGNVDESYSAHLALRALDEEEGKRREPTREERLESSIRWALGETDDFPPGKPDQGAYWWRTELRRRAGLTYTPSQHQ